MTSLATRLAYWARANRWRLIYAVGRDEFTQKPFVLARVGVHVARGRTAGEATEELTRLLARQGVRDDDREQVAAA